MNTQFHHESVMPDEVMSLFRDPAGKIFVDATAGGGGHLALLAEAVGPHGRVYAFDRDPRAHQEDAAAGVARRYSSTVRLFHQPFSQIRSTLAHEGVHAIDGLLCDLGVSSHQLDDQTRGFSFMAEGPIDMRMDTSSGISAYDWLRNTDEETIANTLYRLGGERKSRAVARRIKEADPLPNSTLELARLIVSGVRQKHYSKIHPATRSFQAIRMAVNHEFEELEALLLDVPTLLAPHGVAVFLSFHSIEDRLIKHAFKRLALGEEFELLTKKPRTASDDELSHNRRARSAKLRAIKRVA